jgi:HK97 family phage major capsid protein
MPATTTGEALPTTYKGLIDERESNRIAAQKIHEAACAEGRALNTEEQASFDKHSARAGECLRALNAAHMLSNIEAENGVLDTRGASILPAAGWDGASLDGTSLERQKRERTCQRAFNYYLRSKCADYSASDEERAAIASLNLTTSDQIPGRWSDIRSLKLMQRAALRGQSIDEIELAPLAEKRNTMSALDGPRGGALVPQTFIRRLEAAMLYYGGILQEAEIIRTDSGDAMTWPTFNDTGNTGRRIGENSAVTPVRPTVGNVKWYAHKYTSDELLIPYELIEDNGVDLISMIADMLGERIGRILNQECTIGTGASMPMGIVTAAPVGRTAPVNNAIAVDDVVRLIYSVNASYRNNAKFMMHDDILMLLWLLKDTTGQPLFRPSWEIGKPDLILGRPVVSNSAMTSALAASADVAIFGDFTYYKIREVNDMRFYRLVERHRENDQDAFLTFARRDGNLLDAGGNPIKKLRMAA